MTLATLQSQFALPEIIMAGFAVVILMLGLFMRTTQREQVCYWMSIGALLFTACVIVYYFPTDSSQAFNGLFVFDPMSAVLKITIVLLSAAVFIYSRQYNIERGLFKNEYYVLGLFSVCGMMVMVSANHLLTLYLGLELMSLCMYTMIAFQKEGSLAVEAAMKYFVLGALASSVLLFGMSLLYGLTGSLELNVISQNLLLLDENNLALALAAVFIVVSVAFKLGVAPFHMWLPDVYHGAPTSTTAFIGSVPKIAAFALTMRLLVGGMEVLHPMWQQMLIVLAILSVAIGNIIAIAQSNLKRMLAYSTISHMGFFLFGILSGTAVGYSASMFYVMIYAVMSAAAFGMVLYLSNKDNESDKLSDLKGLSKRNPWAALLMLILMFSMAGVPPTAGFFAKLSVIQALVNADLIWVAVVAMLMAVIGAYYYLRVVKLMYFDDLENETVHSSRLDFKWVLSVNILFLVIILPWINQILELTQSTITW